MRYFTSYLKKVILLRNVNITCILAFITRITCNALPPTLHLSDKQIRIRKSFIAKCVCTHKEFVLVLGASSTETIQYKQTTETTYN